MKNKLFFLVSFCLTCAAFATDIPYSMAELRAQLSGNGENQQDVQEVNIDLPEGKLHYKIGPRFFCSYAIPENTYVKNGINSLFGGGRVVGVTSNIVLVFIANDKSISLRELAEEQRDKSK